MNRIDKKFNELKKMGKKALITFVTAGDPDMRATKDIVREMVLKGADIVELGVPFSDPVAEGPVIQAANARALSKGLKIDDVMAAVNDLRNDINIPLLFLLYFNSILQYGIARFFENCKNSGIDGVIIPDLPFEERQEIEEFADENDIIVITLVSPASRDRIEAIARNARGFLYCVSSLGVTGVRKDFNTDFKEFFAHIDRATDIPKALGFGISSVEQVNALKNYCDGLIIGSAIVKIIENNAQLADAIKNIGIFVQQLRGALDS
ncbi:MAG: tryptophan synthase subunit alpha [Ruminiclostridium sp.]|nr:tryptophan synthase subunit alpha [Ruminiclostridium sp.]